MNDFTDFSDRLLLLVIKQVESYIPGKYNVQNFLFFDAYYFYVSWTSFQSGHVIIFSSKIRSFKFEYVPKIYNIIVVFPLMETIVIVFSIFVNHQTEKIVILGL